MYDDNDVENGDDAGGGDDGGCGDDGDDDGDRQCVEHSKHPWESHAHAA